MLRPVFVLVVVAMVMTALTATAAFLAVRTEEIGVFHPELVIEPSGDLIAATVEIEPESLQKDATRLVLAPAPVSALVELPAGIPVEEIQVDTVRLCRGTQPCAGGLAPADKGTFGDHDGDGVRDLRLTFDGGEVMGLLTGLEAPETVQLTVSGKVGALGRTFAGSDSVTLAGADATPTPTGTPEADATTTPIAGATQTPQDTPTPAPTGGPGASPTPTATETQTPTPTPTPEATDTPTPPPPDTPTSPASPEPSP